MDPLTLGLILGGTGLGKSLLVDAPQEARDRKAAAEVTKWSPWTGMQPGAVKKADPLGSVMTWGSTGAQLGQGLQNQQAYNDYLARTGPGAPMQNSWMLPMGPARG